MKVQTPDFLLRSTLVIAIAALSGCGQGPAVQEGPSATAPGHAPQAAGIYEGTITGMISKMKGASEYVFIERATGDVYSISDQEKLEPFAGRRVAVEGHIDPERKYIHIHDIDAR